MRSLGENLLLLYSAICKLSCASPFCDSVCLVWVFCLFGWLVLFELFFGVLCLLLLLCVRVVFCWFWDGLVVVVFWGGGWWEQLLTTVYIGIQL